MSVLAVVAKECAPGRVKTRLTPPLSPQAAADVARASLAMVLAAVRATPVDRRLLFFDGRPPAGNGFEVLPQPAGGLDARLASLFDAVDEPLLLIGMDTPQVAPALLTAALAALDGADACLGAAADGGFWALGMARPTGEVIRGVPMSTAWTGAVQRARLDAAGLTVADLPVLRDVDTIRDAREVAALVPDSPFAAALAAEAAA